MNLAAIGAPAAAPAQQEALLAIELDDAPLATAIAACVQEIHVDKTLDQADHATLRLATWDVDKDKATWIDDASLVAGKRLVLSLGYGSDLATVFDGDLVGFGLELHSDQRPVMTLDGYDVLHRLGRGRPPPLDLKDNSTYGDIVTEIANRYRLDTDIQGSGADKQNANVKQQNESDLQFIKALATEIGYELFADGRKLVFRKEIVTGATSFTLDASDIVELTGRIDTTGQIGALDGSAFDHDKNASIQLSIDNPDSFDRAFGNVTVKIAHPLQVDSKEQLQARLDAELLRIRNTYLDAHVTCFGRTDAKPGQVIALSGIAKRFDGAYTITAVTHTMSQAAGFRTRLTLKGMRR